MLLEIDSLTTSVRRADGLAVLRREKGHKNPTLTLKASFHVCRARNVLLTVQLRPDIKLNKPIVRVRD